jgi:hypothetical protein
MKIDYALLRGYAVLGFFGLLIILASWGWCWNIAKIFTATTFSGEIVARVIGVVVPPVGAVMGWL